MAMEIKERSRGVRRGRVVVVTMTITTITAAAAAATTTTTSRASPRGPQYR